MVETASAIMVCNSSHEPILIRELLARVNSEDPVVTSMLDLPKRISFVIVGQASWSVIDPSVQVGSVDRGANMKIKDVATISLHDFQ